MPEGATAHLALELCNFVPCFSLGTQTKQWDSHEHLYGCPICQHLHGRLKTALSQRLFLETTLINNIFIIWPHGEEALMRFHQDLNNVHPNINHNIGHSQEQVNFLDTKAQLSSMDRQTPLYTGNSQTDHHIYLPPALTLNSLKTFHHFIQLNLTIPSHLLRTV